MYLEYILDNSLDYLHVASLIKEPCEIVYHTEDSLIFHHLESDTFVAETSAPLSAAFLSALQTASPDLLETTNLALYELLKDQYRYGYQCFQYSFPVPENANRDEHLTLLRPEDLDYVIRTYENEDYVRELFERNRLLGYYDHGKLIGYIARHVDGTIGALFVAPEFRRMGYGKRISMAGISHFSDHVLYSQVLDNNVASIRLHQLLGAIPSKNKINWMFNREFSFITDTASKN